MQPSADLWITLCRDLEEQRRQARREEYARVGRDFVAAAKQILRPGSSRLGDACEIAGDICGEAATREDALEFYREAYRIALDAGSFPVAGRVAGKIAELFGGPEEGSKAAVYYERALNHFEAADDHSQHMALLNGLAGARKRCRDFRGAKAAYLQAIEIVSRLHCCEHPDVALLYNNLGVAMTEAGDFTAAEDAHFQALALREHIFGANHPEVAHSLANIAVVNHLRGDLPKARNFYQAALEIYRQFCPPGSPELEQIEGNVRLLPA